MAKIDELNAAVASLQTTVDAVSAKIDELRNTNNDSAIEAAASAINEAVAKLNDAIADPVPNPETPSE